MKMTMWAKGESKDTGTVILVEWVKNPPSRRTVVGDMETITIRDTTWIKVAGQWIEEQSPPLGQPATGQEQGSQASDEIIRQLEQKSTYKETGRDTVGGIPCKLYTYSGEITVSGLEGMQGEATARGTGEVCVADRPGLPQVVIRSRGESSIKMQMALQPDMPAREVTLEMLSETELYDINAAITIAPPTEVMMPPAPPVAPTAPSLPTRGAGQPAQPGLASLTPVPELKPCFDSFPLPASAKPDSDTAGLARIIAAGLGSPSEARGYVTSDPAAQVQQFIETKALAAGWELGTMMQGQNMQYWAKDRCFIVLNIFPPSGDRKETAIALACGLGQGTAPTATKPVATGAPRPTATTVAAAGPTPAGETWTVDFEEPLDRSWYAQGGVNAEVDIKARPGYLRFTAGSGNDLFPGTNFDAPTRYRIVGGDFTLETAVEFDPQAYYQGAGLFIWQDQDNFVRLERCFDGESGVCFLKVENGGPEVITTAGAMPTTAGRVELRLQKTDNHIAAWWRDAAGGAWQLVGETEIELPGGPQPLTKSALRGGMLLCVEQGATEISADFDYWRMTQ
jgi:regulation of enolase protein 1 (concanavalin A-like superfamily)